MNAFPPDASDAPPKTRREAFALVYRRWRQALAPSPIPCAASGYSADHGFSLLNGAAAARMGANGWARVPYARRVLLARNAVLNARGCAAPALP